MREDDDSDYCGETGLPKHQEGVDEAVRLASVAIETIMTTGARLNENRDLAFIEKAAIEQGGSTEVR